MLKITVPPWDEDWDPVENRFLPGNPKETVLTLEHSLVSISKWESKYHKPYLSEEPKTDEEVLYYIQCMTISNPNKTIREETYRHLSYANLQAIEEYIKDPMTATTIHRRGPVGARKQIITSELIYYWMTAMQIPFECQRWHLNRLLMLIEVAGIKNSPPNKMSRKDMAMQNRSLNASRRAAMRSRG